MSWIKKGLPNVSSPVSRWSIPITVQKITKDTVNFEIRETKTDISFKGVWQPFSPKQLSILPEGQRSWEWIMLHTLTNIEVKIDDRIEYEGKVYRVMSSKDYSLYGYFEFSLVNDFQYQVPDEN